MPLVRRVWYNIPNGLYRLFSGALHVVTTLETPQSIYSKQEWLGAYPYP